MEMWAKPSQILELESKATEYFLSSIIKLRIEAYKHLSHYIEKFTHERGNREQVKNCVLLALFVNYDSSQFIPRLLVIWAKMQLSFFQIGERHFLISVLTHQLCYHNQKK